MRLLETRYLELVNVPDDEVPTYAILSHTWGDGEVTLQELQRMKSRVPQGLDWRKRNISEKKGFQKIKEAAALAAMRGFGYLWVDTCCIDKTSSAELSEAINSMYLWYQRSAECYVYLSDVEVKDWSDDSRLRTSRWFTRGWTLQELVAPKEVLFYAKNWTLLGRKDGPLEFTRIISEITGVDQEVLDGRVDPLQLSISTRMKWASLRQTTRLEDTAYSLMGLFQVNMPLLYGEGSRAFTRLQEAILQSSDDQSIYAWNSNEDGEEDPDALSGLLAPSPGEFKDSIDIQPLPPSPVYASAPSAMTNHGLRVQLYLRPLLEDEGVSMEQDYWAILDCFVRLGDDYMCPVLRLRRLSQDQYARLQTKSRKWLSPVQSMYISEFEGYRTIYVRSQPVYYHLPQFRISPTHMKTVALGLADPQIYQLAEIYPSRHWNSRTMTMNVKYTRKLQAMGLFRFRSTTHDEKVDIVVGLRRLDAMQWEGWCFQLMCSGSSMESTLSVANEKISALTRSKTQPVTAATLRNILGDDSKLKSEAMVEGLQIQGRLYISISMTVKPEIYPGRELKFITTPMNIAGPSLAMGSHTRFADSEIKALTSPFWMIDPCLSGPKDSPWTSEVRVNQTSKGTFSNHHHLTELINRYLDSVRDNKKFEMGTESQLTDALALAAFEGNSVRINELLRKGADIRSYSSEAPGFTPLHWAVAGNSLDAMNTLLENGADPAFTVQNGWSVMHVAAILGRSVWKALSLYCHSEEGRGALAVSRATYSGDSALHFSAQFGTNDDSGALFINELASDLEDYTSIFLLNNLGETPLHRAAACNNDVIIRAIHSIYVRKFWGDPTLSARVNQFDAQGRTAAWHAAATGSLDALRQLISLGAVIDSADDMGRTPLHAAARGGYSDIVSLLLDKGVSRSRQTFTLGLTPMHYAAIFGHSQCLSILSKPRNDQHLLISSTEQSINLEKHRALHFAASCGWYECVQTLCELGADPFVTHGSYLRFDDNKDQASLVEQELDARGVALTEGHPRIVEFFDDSILCEAARRRKQGLPQLPPTQASAPEEITTLPAQYRSDFMYDSIEHSDYQAPAMYSAQPITQTISRPGGYDKSYAPVSMSSPTGIVATRPSESVTMPAIPTPYQEPFASRQSADQSFGNLQENAPPQSMRWVSSNSAAQYPPYPPRQILPISYDPATQYLPYPHSPEGQQNSYHSAPQVFPSPTPLKRKQILNESTNSYPPAPANLPTSQMPLLRAYEPRKLPYASNGTVQGNLVLMLGYIGHAGLLESDDDAAIVSGLVAKNIELEGDYPYSR